MRSFAIALWLMACEGGSPPEIDANPAGPRCSGMTYDLCIEEHDCENMMCKSFEAQSFVVCTLPCGTGCPPDKSGAAGVCDNGVCRPSAPNMCHF